MSNNDENNDSSHEGDSFEELKSESSEEKQPKRVRILETPGIIPTSTHSLTDDDEGVSIISTLGSLYASSSQTEKGKRKKLDKEEARKDLLSQTSITSALQELLKTEKGDELNQEGKHLLYSKYVDQSASVMKQSRRSFVFDGLNGNVTSVSSIDVTNPFQGSVDFTHGFHENRQTIIPSLTEHETQRLGCNKFLEEAAKIGNEIDFRSQIALSLSYLTVLSTSYIKETFQHLSKDVKLIGNVYSARMLGRYQEYGKLFKFISGREGAMAASMRYTSHCSDIIKSYITLAKNLEDSQEFSNIIMELARRHITLNLKLRDHQLHYKPFTDILGSWSEDPLKIYCSLLFFVSMVSRSMIKAEFMLKQSMGEDATASKMGYRNVRMNRAKVETSRKQPTWD